MRSILLSNNCGYSWKVNTTKKDKYGNILYKSRIFVKIKIKLMINMIIIIKRN